MDQRTYDMLVDQDGQNISAFLRYFRDGENCATESFQFMAVRNIYGRVFL
jgi:hypothetical protein